MNYFERSVCNFIGKSYVPMYLIFLATDYTNLQGFFLTQSNVNFFEQSVCNFIGKSYVPMCLFFHNLKDYFLIYCVLINYLNFYFQS